jgi:hypothetical protein
VEELWSPILARRLQIRLLKHALIASVHFQRIAEVFLSQASLNWI